MLVYRVENETGAGPYGLTEWQESCHADCCGRPGPELDDGDFRDIWFNISVEKRGEYKFGFQSLALLRQWFSETELLNLSDLGFRVAIYEAEDVLSSSRQCAFIPIDDCPDEEVEMSDFIREYLNEQEY